VKKIIPLISSSFCVLLILYFWDLIKLPYNENNLIIGNYYYNKINPLNDTIRFLIFLTIPFLIYLIFFKKYYENTYSLKIKSENYFLKFEENKKQNILSNYLFFFIIFILFEFITLDFKFLVRPIDFFHEGTYLVPAINHLEDKNLFGPTLYDYGFIANNLAVISSYIFGFLSIGGFYIIKLILVFLVKLSLIFISRSLVSSLELENNYKINFFVLFTFIIISLPDYYNPLIFYQRYLLYLLFILYLGLTLTNQKNKFQLLTLGFFSLFSVLWWWDIGAYTNALIFLTLVYLLIHREFKNFLLLLIGISISWGIFFLISGTETLENFFYQFNFIYSASDYLLGIEYPIPFSEDSIRGTKTLIIFYLISVMLIHLNLSKKYKVSFKTKILLNTLFLAGIIGFKTALMRSDTPHIKYASGIIFFLILFLILFFIFQRLKASNNILSVYKKYNINFILFILLSIYYLSGIPETGNSTSFLKKVDNLKNFKKNISYLLNAQDSNYLNNNYALIVKRYKELAQDDNCIQSFTDDISLPYFLKKPTCTKYFISGAQILNKKSEKNFINEFNTSLPKIILYDSPIKYLINPLNMPTTQKFINENYSFYEKFNGFIFYKKN